MDFKYNELTDIGTVEPQLKGHIKHYTNYKWLKLSIRLPHSAYFFIWSI